MDKNKLGEKQKNTTAYKNQIIKKHMKKITSTQLIGTLLIISGISILIVSNIDYTNKLMITFMSNTISSEQSINSVAWDFIKGLETIIGALMTGWGITFFSIQDTPKNKKIILIAITTWFLIDSSGSLLHGFMLNFPPNLIFYLIAIGALLLDKNTTKTGKEKLQEITE